MNLNPVRSQPMLGSASSQRSGLQFSNQTEILLHQELIKLIANATKEAYIDARNPFVRDILQVQVKKYIEALNRFSDSNTLNYGEQKKTKNPIFTLRADHDKKALAEEEYPPELLADIELAKQLGYTDPKPEHWKDGNLNPWRKLGGKEYKKGSPKIKKAPKQEKPTEARLPLSHENTLPFMRKLSKQGDIFEKLEKLQRKLEKLQKEKASTEDLIKVEDTIKRTKKALQERLQDVSLFRMPSFSQAHPKSTKRHKLLTPPNLLEAFPNRTDESKAVRKKIEKNRSLKDIRVTYGFDPQSKQDTIVLTWNKPDGSMQHVEIFDDNNPVDTKSPEIQALFQESNANHQTRNEVFVQPLTAEQEATRQARLDEARSKPFRTLADHKREWEINNAKYLQTCSLRPNLKAPNPSSDNAKQAPLKNITININSNGRYLEWQKTDGTTEQRDLPESMKGSKVNTKAPDIQSLFD